MPRPATDDGNNDIHLEAIMGMDKPAQILGGGGQGMLQSPTAKAALAGTAAIAVKNMMGRR